MNIEKLEELTLKYGGSWGLNHSFRVLNTALKLDTENKADREILSAAAFMHDWGAYAPWKKDGADHTQVSLDVVSGFLKEERVPPDTKEHILELIRYHHGGPAERSYESFLFTDADCLDFLGCIGIAREFSKNPRNLHAAAEHLRNRMESVPQLISLPAAVKMAECRLKEMEDFLSELEEMTEGFY